MYDPGACVYMEKLVTGPEAADVVDITAPVRHNIEAVAKAKGGDNEDVTVVILDRPRHDEMVREIREAGARIKFIVDGDVAGAIMAVRDGTGVDLLLGIGGTPEGIIAACAIKVPRRDDPEPAVAAQRRGARDGARAGARPGPGALLRRPGQQRQRLLRGHRRDRRRAGARRALPRRRSDDALARHAVAQRHDPLRGEPSPAPQADGVQLGQLRAPQGLTV
jgi:hypothetical protein